WEPRPPADDHQPWQHEDDRRQRARRRRDRLHDVVFENRRVLDGAQDRHRDHGGGNGRREREAGLEAQVEVGGGEERGGQSAEDQRANCELFWFHEMAEMAGAVPCYRAQSFTEHASASRGMDDIASLLTDLEPSVPVSCRLLSLEPPRATSIRSSQQCTE